MRIIETCPRCGHDLVDLILASNPPIPKKKCFSCGWSWIGEPDEVIRVPFGGNTYRQDENENCSLSVGNFFQSSACKLCSNNPANGGSGICHCILGQQAIW